METYRPVKEQSAPLQVWFALAMIVVVAALAGCAIDHREQNSLDLARRLAGDKTRAVAVNEAVGRGDEMLPRLLSWAETAPPHVDRCGLDIGLAEVFGRLKSKQAIPFLIRNISLRRTCPIDMNPWHQTPDVVEATFPCIAALLNIGPDASTALMRAWESPMSASDRLAALFVIARTSGIPEARQFLTSVLRKADLERFWAEEGLKVLDERR
jgi:hypothetical protein